MSVLAQQLQRFIYRADRAWGRQFRSARTRLGLAGSPRLIPLDGWSNGERAVIRARVVERQPGVSWLDAQRRRDRRVSRPRRLLRRALFLYHRFGALEVPDARVEVQYGGARLDARSDPTGTVVVAVPAAQANSAELRLGSDGTVTQVPVYTPGPTARYLIVSDIDDTVLETELENPVRRFAQLLLSDRPVRLPFAGVAELYRALTRSGDPIFYVSNSPPNLHEHLNEIFRMHDMPAGPLLLRPWGLTETGIVPFSGGRRHKQESLQQLAADFPNLPIVLIGDSSRRDADEYLALAERAPGRVAAIYIRRVQGPLSFGIDHDALRARADHAGVELVVVDTTLEAAQHAAARGFIAAEDVAAVRRASVKEEARSDVLEDLVTSA